MWSTSWLFLLEAVIIVIGNATTIVIFTTTSRLRHRKYLLIVNMAIADLFVGCITLPCYVYYREGPDYVSLRFEYTFESVDIFFGTASFFGLSSLAIERAHATFFPFRHSALSYLPYKIAITIVWIGALTHTLLSLFVLKTIPRLHDMAVVLAVCLVVISIAYLLIWWMVTCRKNQSAAHISNKKLTVTLGIVTVASFITLMPLLVTSVYGIICGEACLYDLHSSLVSIATFLYCGNSAVNFFIYAMRIREFRVEIVRRMKCSTRTSESNRSIEMHNMIT